MRRWILLVLLLLLVVAPMCIDVLISECYLDSDCEDHNSCTKDTCRTELSYDNDEGCGSDYWYVGDCIFRQVDDGAPCDVDGEPGMCEAGECRPSGEASEPTVDGGV